MEQITAYKLSNGRIVENEQDAINQENKIALKQKVKKFADEHGYSTETKGIIFDVIFDNVNELRNILND